MQILITFKNILMKAKLYALFLVSIPFASVAQPTVNTAEDYTIGMVVRYKQAANASPGPDGSQTWNFSTLTPLGGSDTLTFSYLAAGSTYAGANMLERSSNKQDHYYNETGNTNHTVALIDSVSAPSTIINTYSNTALGIQRPLTYHLNVTDTFAGNLQYSSFNMPGTGTRNLHVDGYGTLILPGNKTFNDVLRVRTEHTQTNASGPITVNVNVITYAWYDAAHKAPLLRIDSFMLGGTPPVPAVNTPTTSYLIDETYPGNVAEINSGKSITASLAGQTLTVNGELSPATHELMLYNMEGRMLFRAEFPAKGNRQIFNTHADLPQGIYFITLSEKGSLKAPVTLKILKQ
jgi:hypothetical protein